MGKSRGSVPRKHPDFAKKYYGSRQGVAIALAQFRNKESSDIAVVQALSATLQMKQKSHEHLFVTLELKILLSFMKLYGG
ncbi:MAG TPA: hypothetical protein V6D33_00210 [Cyanophyceae cyanobacterium]